MARTPSGLDVEFIAANPDEYWELAGRVQRRIGIKPEYFNHPDALRVHMDVLMPVRHLFEGANPKFSLYSSCEFSGPTLTALRDALVDARFVDPELVEFGQRLTTLIERTITEHRVLLSLGV